MSEGSKNKIRREKTMERGMEKELHDEIVGVLTAISIVSKRLATRLSEQGKKGKEQDNNKGDKSNE